MHIFVLTKAQMDHYAGKSLVKSAKIIQEILVMGKFLGIKEKLRN